MYPSGTLVYTSKELEGVGYIFYPYTNISTFKKFKNLIVYSIGLTSMMKHISLKEFRNFVKAISSNSSAWIDEFISDEFIHIDLVVVDENYRNKGFASVIINEVIVYADENNLKVTLETQNPLNVEIYKRFGFEIVKEQKYKDLIQYCMIRMPK